MRRGRKAAGVSSGLFQVPSVMSEFVTVGSIVVGVTVIVVLIFHL